MSGDKTPNFSEMSDEQILNTDPTELTSEGSKEVANDKSEEDPEALAEGSDELKSGDTPDDSGEDDPETPEEAGGADPSEGTDDSDPDDSDAVEEGDKDDTQDPFAGSDSEPPKGDQPKDKGKEGTPDDKPDSDDVNYETAYKELMAPFKAARREVRLDNIEDARRLMQMGVDYSNKMRQMKPHLRILRTLEKAKLTDPEQVNFLIDLKEGNPDAIKKLLKEGSIDPMELDLEGSEPYKPTDHMIGDTELNLTEAFDSISESPKYQDTLKALDHMDTVSKQQLQDNPGVIPVINSHIEAGIFEKVWGKVEMERMLGRLSGLSDLDAYYKVGEAMHQAGALGVPEASSAPGNTAQASAQGNGSPAGTSTSKERKDQKRAASPTRGRAAQSGPKVPDFAKMSDEAIEKLDLSTLL